MRKCQNCKEEFDGETKFCSQKCRYASRTKYKDVFIIQCRQCGEDIETRYTETIYCSRHCQAKWQSNHRSAETLAKFKLPRKRKRTVTWVIKKCEYCQKEFESKEWLNQKYCSLDCSNNSNKGKRKPKAQVECRHCHKLFEVWPHDAQRRKYCSNACHKKHPWNEGRTKETHPTLKKMAKKIKKFIEENGTWNEGLTKETNASLAAQSENLSKLMLDKYEDRRMVVKCKKCDNTYETYIRDPQVYCSIACKMLDFVSISKPETLFLDRLEEIYGLTIDRQLPLKNWLFDGRIKGTNILIESDGSYFHSREDVKKRDKAKEKYAERKGFVVYRFENSIVEEIEDNIKKYDNVIFEMAWSAKEQISYSF